MGKWDTDTVKLKVEPVYKPFNDRYYPVPKIKKCTFCKELQHLVEIGVLTPIHQLQYGKPVFIIPKKYGITRFIVDYRMLNHKIVINTHNLLRIGETVKQL